MKATTLRQQAQSGVLNLEEACLYLGFTPYFIRKLIRSRRIPFIQLGRAYFFRRASLDSFLAAQEASNVVPQTAPATLPHPMPAMVPEAQPATPPRGIIRAVPENL